VIDQCETEFYETMYDQDGHPVNVLKQYISKNSKSGDFTTYDTSHGHCGLCGSLSCNGQCFR